MERTFEIIYEQRAIVDLKSISLPDRRRIKQSIEKKLSERPEVFGKPLRKSLRGYRSFRVGVYRIVFRIEGVTVLIFVVAHRGEVYQRALKRV